MDSTATIGSADAMAAAEQFAREFFAFSDTYRERLYGVRPEHRAPTTFAEMAESLKMRRKLMYTLQEVSTVLGVEYGTLRDECTAGRLKYHLPEGRKQGMLVRPEWVDEWIEEGTHGKDDTAC